MNIHDATEQAYKNGWEDGYKKGLSDKILNRDNPEQLLLALGRVVEEYDFAAANRRIHKPIAYALYQAWKYFDMTEGKNK